MHGFSILKFMPLWSARKKPTGYEKAMKVELRILLPGCCKGDIKPIDGAIMLGNKTLASEYIILLLGMQHT